MKRALKAKQTKIAVFDDQHLADRMLKFLRKFASASRKQIYELLWDKLSDSLSDVQKKSKIENFLNKLRIGVATFNAGSRAAPEWKARE